VPRGADRNAAYWTRGRHRLGRTLLLKIGVKAVTEVQQNKVGGKTVETINERTAGGVLRRGTRVAPTSSGFSATSCSPATPGTCSALATPLRA